jgi:hypothetical protein
MLFGVYVHGADGLSSLMAYLAAVFCESMGESIVS